MVRLDEVSLDRDDGSGARPPDAGAPGTRRVPRWLIVPAVLVVWRSWSGAA